MRATSWRLALTVWLVYGAFAATNVVRETYLAVALGDRASIRVDEFLGLHPDLFAIPGRGAYINSNPGASLLGAVPYVLARPALALLFRARPSLVAPKPPARYDDPRPNRNRFMNEARARGLDVKLVLATLIMTAGLMAPAGALMAVLVFRFFAARLGDQRTALWLAVLFAVGTPVLFRSAFINQNLLLGHATLAAFLLYAWPRVAPPTIRVHVAAGALLGFGVLCDYSGVPLALVFGLWACAHGWRHARLAGALRSGAAFTSGAAGPLAVLAGYQWAAFGSPLFPAQHYMPPTPYSVIGSNGMTLPDPDLLWRNLLDPEFGLFVFCPMLIAALAAPWLRGRRGALRGEELALSFGASGALYLFSSANQFAHLQFNTGVRYMVPAAQLLFIALVPALLALPRLWRWALVGPTLVVSLAVAMTRENVPHAFARLAHVGVELPIVAVAAKTAGGYATWLTPAVAVLLSLGCLAGLGALVWLIWRGQDGAALSARAR